MTSVKLAPAVQQLISEMPRGVPGHLSPAEQREYLHLLSDLAFHRYGMPGPEVHSVTEHEVPVAGGRIFMRVYRPSADKGLPGHISLHGGGWKSGSVTERTVDAICRRRCRDADCIVFSVEYRLAPEHRFPVPLDDCYAALLWTVEHAGELGLDADNLSIGGSSAGANLAAAVALRCRDEDGPGLVFQLLEVPALDLTREIAKATLASGVLPDVPQPTMADATDTYLADRGEAGNPLASPLLAPDLSGLPPAHVMTAEYDVLRTEGERYAQRLAAAGVPVTHERYPGALHGTALLTRSWDEARRWQCDAGAALHRAHWIPGK
ncbi:alpha/beta hydrolase [Amycolatopsis rhizosphaerae]|uniref:Alpha/beta hydrolase n=1 Tax=Amycolatopsis rhizosphaerae TaxID=2053003 RepID=A0A558C9Z2_9PSEU|nr:alpha/beta hydrolase [Amycolatopsis rhizosphaerae]TVT45601.1 alpha/beta hydrolase [Amycolatopsis rhizosphaerae]